MLMTPITPNVMASPIAASSKTDPSERPYHAFCTTSQMASWFLIEATASRAARMTATGVSGGRLDRSAKASWSPRSRITATASRLSASLASGMNSRTAARASIKASLTVGSVSLAIAASSAGRALASFDLKTARAASSLRDGLAACRVRPPTAASIERRSRLLMRTGWRSGGGSPAMGLPVAASSSDLDASRMRTFFCSALNSRRPSCSASMTRIANGLPLAATPLIASSVSMNESVVNFASASS